MGAIEGDLTKGNGRPSLRDRSRSEAALRRAVLRILKQNGVLAGVNLQEVSDLAGVNRGLVYQYFGNRQELLRSAMRESISRWVPRVSRRRKAGFVDRVENAFKASLADPWMTRLLTLLVLDGDKRARSMPLYTATHASFLQDVEDGVLSSDVDVDAVHAVIAAIMHGYTIHRRGYAREIGVTVSALDERVLGLVRRLLSTLETPRAGSVDGAARVGGGAERARGGAGEEHRTPRQLA